MTELAKLVRDRIPEIIRESGRVPEVSIVEGAQFIASLKEKLLEEAQEVSNATEDQIIEELADVLEVIDGIIETLEIDRHLLASLKAKKFADRGGFTRGLILH